MAASELFTTSLKIDANLQGYWRFESNVTDSGPNGYNLTANGSPTYEAGEFNNAIKLVSASSQSASIVDASCANLEIAGSQTWGAWIKPSALAQQAILVKCPAGAAAYGALQIVDASGHIQIFLSGLSTPNFESTAAVTAAAWNFVVMRYNTATSTFDCFINGTKESHGSITGSHTDTDGDFAVGKFGAFATPFYFDGDIDDAWIFNRALTDTEIGQLYTGWPSTSGGFFAFA